MHRRIGQAVSEGRITKEMASWAHEVRLDANDQRHSDVEAEHSTTADAQRCIEFVRAFGEYLFVLPARVRRGLQAAQGVQGQKKSKADRPKG